MDAEAVNEWSEKIKQQKASGKSAATWCGENNVHYQKFLRWRKRLSSDESLERSSFVESKEGQDEIWMEIIMHGARCTFTKQFTREAVEHLSQVIKGL
jgi:hypothetical protein